MSEASDSITPSGSEPILPASVTSDFALDLTAGADPAAPADRRPPRRPRLDGSSDGLSDLAAVWIESSAELRQHLDFLQDLPITISNVALMEEFHAALAQ